jgi:Protein of unknown function (DUF4232)
MDDNRTSDATGQILRDFVSHVSQQVVVPEFPAEREGFRRPRRASGGRRMLAVGFATVAVIGAVILVVAYGPRSSRLGPNAALGTTPKPGSSLPSSTSPLSDAFCQAAQLRATVSFNQSGTDLGAVRLTNTTARACALSGQPTVRVLDGAGKALKLTESIYQRAPDWPPPTRPIILSPAGALPQGIVEIEWTWCGTPPGSFRFEIQFPGWTSPLDVPNTDISPGGFVPASCTNSDQQPLLAVDDVRGVDRNGIVGPAPTSSGNSTDVITYEPFTATGVSPTLHVISYSRGPAGRSLFRCFSTSSEVFDPCFAGPHSTTAPLVCPTVPTSNDVVEFTVTAVTTDEPATPTEIPWAIQLSSGQVCLLLSAAWGGLGPYACHVDQAIQSAADCHSPQPSQTRWTTACQAVETQASSFTSQDVTTVWF